MDAQVNNALLRIHAIEARRILQAYAQGLKEIRDVLGRLYEKAAGPDGKLTLAQMTRYNRLQTTNKEITRIMNQKYGIVVRSMDVLAEEIYNASYFRYAWAFDQNSGVALTWGSVNEDLLKAAAHNPLDLISKNTLSVATRNRIRTATIQGTLQGKSYPKMMQDIRKAMGINISQAMRIARTEGQRIQSQATEIIYDRAVRNGIRGDEIWDAVLEIDEKRMHKPKHQLLDGEPRGADGFWTLGGNKTTGPLLFGIASYNINCRCRRRFQVEGFSPQIRRTRDSGIIPYTTYSDWRPGLSSRGKFKGVA